MTKRLILAFVFLSWHLVACSNGDSGISSGLPDKPSAEEDSPGTETISEEMRVKITGEDLYISAKLDAKPIFFIGSRSVCSMNCSHFIE